METLLREEKNELIQKMTALSIFALEAENKDISAKLELEKKTLKEFQKSFGEMKLKFDDQNNVKIQTQNTLGKNTINL